MINLTMDFPSLSDVQKNIKTKVIITKNRCCVMAITENITSIRWCYYEHCPLAEDGEQSMFSGRTETNPLCSLHYYVWQRSPDLVGDRLAWTARTVCCSYWLVLPLPCCVSLFHSACRGFGSVDGFHHIGCGDSIKTDMKVTCEDLKKKVI